MIAYNKTRTAAPRGAPLVLRRRILVKVAVNELLDGGAIAWRCTSRRAVIAAQQKSQTMIEAERLARFRAEHLIGFFCTMESTVRECRLLRVV